MDDDDDMPPMEPVVCPSRDDIAGTAGAWELEKVTRRRKVGIAGFC